MRSSPHQTDSSPQHRHVLRNALIAIVLLIGIVVGMAFLLARRDLSRVTQESQALGPVTLEELEARRRTWPPGQDAGLAFIPIAQELTQLEKPTSDAQRELLRPVPMIGDVDLPTLGHLWTPRDQKEAEVYITRMSHFYERLNDLRRYPGGKLPLKLSPNPLDIILPELTPVRTSAKLECLAIVDRAMLGKLDDLEGRLEVLDRLRNLIDDQPTLISALVTVATDSLVCQTVERAISVDGIAPASLPVIEQSLDTRLRNAPIKCGLMGERAMFMTLTRQARSGTITGISVPAVGRIPILNILSYWDTAYGMRLYNQLVAASDNLQELERVARQVDQTMQNAPWWAMLTRILFPSLERAVELTIASRAELQVARVGVAVERFRVEKHRFPDQAAELVPAYLKELPADPFDHKPMRYKRTSEGVLIYSVGLNRSDEGGLRTAKKSVDEGDLVFTVLSPEFRRLPPVAPPTEPASGPSTGGRR